MKRKSRRIAEIQASEGYLAAQQAVKDVEQQFAILGTTPEEIAKILAENELAYQALTPAISGLEELVSSMGYDINALDQYLQEIADGKAQLEGGIAQIQDAIKQLDAGQLAIADAEVQISAGEASGNLQLYTALAQTIAGEQGLESTKAQLESGLTQIEEGEKQIDDSAEQPTSQADLTTILTRDMVSGILQAGELLHACRIRGGGRHAGPDPCGRQVRQRGSSSQYSNSGYGIRRCGADPSGRCGGSGLYR